mmetsp:Transcript_127000/g.317306  ORF Transcript_127000/g.317306 Transcript_127000/m.317306 type:complete len:222 (-) Transcript_127000:476-1141(-)
MMYVVRSWQGTTKIALMAAIQISASQTVSCQSSGHGFRRGTRRSVEIRARSFSAMSGSTTTIARRSCQGLSLMIQISACQICSWLGWPAQAEETGHRLRTRPVVRQKVPWLIMLLSRLTRCTWTPCADSQQRRLRRGIHCLEAPRPMVAIGGRPRGLRGQGGGQTHRDSSRSSCRSWTKTGNCACNCQLGSCKLHWLQAESLMGSHGTSSSCRKTMRSAST